VSGEADLARGEDVLPGGAVNVLAAAGREPQVTVQADDEGERLGNLAGAAAGEPAGQDFLAGHRNRVRGRTAWFPQFGRADVAIPAGRRHVHKVSRSAIRAAWSAARRWSACVSGAAAGLAGGESVGLGAGLEDVGVEGDAVDDFGDEAGVGEHGCPFDERQICPDDDGGLFLAFGDDPEQQLGAAGVELDVTELVELCGCPHRSTKSGFAPLDDTCAQLLFRVVAAAYERRSLGIGSHWPFESWGRLLPEHATAVSLLDRLLHHASVVVRSAMHCRLRRALCGSPSICDEDT
jgi:hypothetical protein